MTLPLSRRAFLKLNGALALGTQLPVYLSSGARIASTWPLPQPHIYFSNPERLLARNLSTFDLLLIPAYTAAELIQQGAAQTLPQTLSSSRGRAHDPEGAFTRPYHYEVVRLPLAAQWLDHPRLVVAAALWARGYSPNDPHPGHLAQIEVDLLAHRQFHRPDSATLVVEYDWVIPQSARLDIALAFLRSQPSSFNLHPSAIPLMPLPRAARSQISQMWACLTASLSA